MAEICLRLFFVLLLGCTFCLLVIADASEESSPANPQMAGEAEGDEGSNDDDVTDPAEIEEANSYLSKYGYYDDDDNKPTQRSGTNVERAIALLQYRAHIPVTGRLNRQTIAMMRMPRCGNKDFNSPSDRLRRRRRRYSLSGNKWDKNHLTYKFINYTPDLPQQTTKSEIARAFNLWSRATNLRFTEVRQGRADIDLRFAYGEHGDGYEFDGRGGILAHAFFPGKSAINGDAHFDDIERFTVNSRSGTNLFMVAAHEFGHSLGLGHSDVKSSMMAPIYQGYRHGIQLHRDDLSAIQSLYGKRRGPLPADPTRPPSNPGPRPPSRPNTPTTPTCNIRVSALMSISQNGLLAFRNDEYWRINYDGQAYSVAQGYPQKFSSRFRAFTGGSRRQALTSVDAAYKRTDGSLRFFKGNEFFDFTAGGSFLQQGNIITLFRRRQRLGAPSSVDAAVMVPNANNMVYLFQGTKYWRLNDEDSRIDPGYPQPLNKWSPELSSMRIDGAFFAADSVFFVSGDHYRRFMWDGYRLEADSYRFDRQFFGCGRLSTNYNEGNGQASSRNVRNWALVPTMLAVSTAACHLLLH